MAIPLPQVGRMISIGKRRRDDRAVNAGLLIGSVRAWLCVENRLGRGLLATGFNAEVGQ